VINYWYSPKIIQQLIQLITPKYDTFNCVVTKQATGEWTFSKWIIKDEPFVGNSDFVIDTIYSQKTCKVPQQGVKAKLTVSINKFDGYDTVFTDPVPTYNGHTYTDKLTLVNAFVCDVAQVFFKGVPEKFYITVDPINIDVFTLTQTIHHT
jgi:hypothetical protein